MLYKQPNSPYWSYKFNWNGRTIRKSTKQANKRVAEQMEAACRTALAKGEVGILERKRIPTFKEFCEHNILPHVESHFAEKPKTIAYYEWGIKTLAEQSEFWGVPLDRITTERIAGLVERCRAANYKLASINRLLQILRRILRLAVEWGAVEKAPPKISLLPGEHRRDRVLSPAEEAAYLKAASEIGDKSVADFKTALEGIRATQRGETPLRPSDPYRLRDVAIVLLDCGLRPEEAYRLRWDQVRDGSLHIPFGKTANARRVIPMPQRCAAILEMRHTTADTEWIFPAPTKSGHIEQSTLKKRHAQACKFAGIEDVPPYTFRHTCLTRWSAHMDPYTLGYLAAHSDFATTRRYVHPQAETVLAAMEKADIARTGHTPRHTEDLKGPERVAETPLPN
jgi:integrase